MVFAYGGTLKTRRDKQWELIQQVLSNDLTSSSAPKFISQRTLFGIQSSTEALLDRVVDEENQRIEQQLRHERNLLDDAGVHNEDNTQNQRDKETSDEL